MSQWVKNPENWIICLKRSDRGPKGWGCQILKTCFVFGDPLYYPDTLGNPDTYIIQHFWVWIFALKIGFFFSKIFIHYAVDFGWMLAEQQFVVSNAAAEDWGAIQFSAMLNVQTDTYKHLGLIITLPLLLQRQHNSGHHSAVTIRAQLPFVFHVYFLRLALCLSLLNH